MFVNLGAESNELVPSEVKLTMSRKSQPYLRCKFDGRNQGLLESLISSTATGKLRYSSVSSGNQIHDAKLISVDFEPKGIMFYILNNTFNK